MTCKGICVRYKAQKPVGTGRYASGQRRCQICEIFIKWEGLWCPCCGYRLRTKPRNLKYKAKLRARVEADSAEAETNSIAAMEQELVAEAAGKTTKTKKAKTTKAKTKTTKNKEKTLCEHCGKSYVFIDKHLKKCTKNPENESIAIKA